MVADVSVLIPYFQRKTGILRRTLVSVLRQRLPAEVQVRVVVVDDGSPVPAEGEVEGLLFENPFELQIVHQANKGVAAARNAALDSVEPTATYIAFLDSDDIWHEDHLARGITALEAGRDFYFCDHRRKGLHASYFAECYPAILRFAASGRSECNEISNNDLVTAILKGIPTQASTVIYRRAISPELRFDERFHAAGEDILFFAELAGKTRKACFSADVRVECGDGVNIYYGNFGWDNAARLPIALDMAAAYSTVGRRILLQPTTREWVEWMIRSHEHDFVYFCLRYLFRQHRIPPGLFRAAQGSWWYPVWFAITASRIALKASLGLYRPQ